jgi:hypothetical protein
MIELALKLYGKPEETLNEYQKRLIDVLYKLRNEVESGRLLTSKIRTAYNEKLPKVVQVPERSKKLFSMLKSIGLNSNRKGGQSFLEWEEDKLQKLFSKHVHDVHDVHNIYNI